VVDHLLSNAVEFTEAGGTVSVGASLEAHGRLLLVVRHTGIGIAEEGTECVFEPFTQLDSTLARRFSGRRPRLYMSRAPVAGHGAELSLHSAPGAGTSLEIRLPAKRVIAEGSGKPSAGVPPE
jgi:signal transduction histidine kinase